MRAKSIVRTSKNKEPEKTRRQFKVLVVVRHTRAGDERREVIDDKGKNSVIWAMDMAEDIAQSAAQSYGEGSASVFRGLLTLVGKPIPSSVAEKLQKETDEERKLRIMEQRAREEPTPAMLAAGAALTDEEQARAIYKAMRAKDER